MRASPSVLAITLALAGALPSATGCVVDGPRYRPVRDSLATRPPVVRPAAAREDAPFVWVLGAVGQPGRYRIVAGAPGASVPTLTLVLRDAGGLGASAYHTVIVSRRVGARWARQAYDVDAIEAGEIDDVPIYAGDVIDVVARGD
jgi:protein involved in polysaccharide export with SLBB domain